jgi:hypothetical protein
VFVGRKNSAYRSGCQSLPARSFAALRISAGGSRRQIASTYRSGCHKFPVAELLPQSLAIVFRPGAIPGHRLQRRSALCSACTRAFHLGFSHARTGFGFQAGTDVNDVVIGLRLTLRIGCWRILGAAARRDKGQQEQQGENSRNGSRAISHSFPYGYRLQQKSNCKNAARIMTIPDSLYTIVVALTTPLPGCLIACA